MLTFQWKYKKLKQIEGPWNPWDIFTGLDPTLLHVPKWRPRQRNEADIAEHVFSLSVESAFEDLSVHSFLKASD